MNTYDIVLTLLRRYMSLRSEYLDLLATSPDQESLDVFLAEAESRLRAALPEKAQFPRFGAGAQKLEPLNELAQALEIMADRLDFFALSDLYEWGEWTDPAERETA